MPVCKSKTLFAVSLVGILIACGDGNSAPVNNTNASDTPMPVIGGTDNQNTSAVTQFDGVWKTLCFQGVPSGSFETLTTINGTSYVADEFNYTDIDCSVPASPNVVRRQVSVVYLQEQTLTDLGNATHINVNVESITLDGAPPSDAQMDELTAAGAFDTIYNLLLVNNDKLYAGDENDELDGSTPEKRPTDIATGDDFIQFRQ